MRIKKRVESPRDEWPVWPAVLLCAIIVGLLLVVRCRRGLVVQKLTAAAPITYSRTKKCRPAVHPLPADTHETATTNLTESDSCCSALTVGSGSTTEARKAIEFSHASSSRDPLHVAVPSGLVDKLKSELRAELTQPRCIEMVWAFGGDPRCFERYLVARQLSLRAAASMFRDTLAFRAEHVARLPIHPELRARCMAWWPVAYAGRTADGHTVQVIRLGNVDVRGVYAQVSEEDFRLFYLHWMELSLRHARSCGANAHQVEIYDLQGLSLSQLYFPGIRMLARVLKIGQAHYPESLHRCVIIHAPKFFAIAWSLVSSVLHERTRMKTRILAGDGAATLQDVLGLDEEATRALFERAKADAADVKEGLAMLTAASGEEPGRKQVEAR